MENKGENKMMKPAAIKQRFFYPEHQVTIEAETKEEADRELEKILKKK